MSADDCIGCAGLTAERNESSRLLSLLRLTLEKAIPAGPHTHSLLKSLGVLVAERDALKAAMLKAVGALMKQYAAAPTAELETLIDECFAAAAPKGPQ